MNVIKNILKNTEFKDKNEDLNGQGLHKIFSLISIKSYRSNQFNKESIVLKDITLHIPLIELGLQKDTQDMIKFSCLSYKNYKGLDPYIDAFVKNNKNSGIQEIENNIWKKNDCIEETNQTHFSCTWKRGQLIAIVENNISSIVLKIFFLCIFFFGMSIIFLFGMVWISSQNKTTTLMKLEPMLKYKMTSNIGVFIVLFKSLHPLTCWISNPVTPPIKALYLNIASIMFWFILGAYILNFFQEDNTNDPEGVYSNFKTTITLDKYVFVFNIVFLLLVETLKALLIKIPYEKGMVELKEISLSHNPSEKGNFIILLK